MAEVTFKTPLTDSYASFTLEECSQFSLDDDDEHQTRATNRQKHGDKGEIEPLTDRRQSSSNQTSTNGLQRNNDNKRTPRTQENKRNGREASRLTDEVELDDGNSDSDDLDLLPPLPTSTSKTNERKRKLKRLVQCCSPYYVRPKLYKMTDFIAANNGLTPTIGLLTSEGVEETAQRNNLSFADLLVPFNGVQISIKDPSGQQSSIKLACNFRDIKRQGYLLSLTVLPSVLKETVRICSQRSSGDDAWSSGFKEFFHYWLEDATHDFLKSYVCCVFAVSTADADPINTLSNLIQQQNYQQHGSGKSANSLSPAHCATPKWFLPQILKYYILVQDVSRDDDEKAKSVFASMSSTYGQQFCYHLKINSSENSNMPDPWSNLIVDRYRGLENGLEAARREIMTKGTSNPAAATAQELSNLSISSIAVSSDINVGALPMTMENNGPKRAAPSTNFATGVTRGDCLSSEDRERIRNFVEHFVKNVLVPFVEKQLATQNEALLSRRGIGKSFTNMKKWLNVASPQSTPTNVNYTNESSEMQTRRLADLAFLFGLYSYSLQLYQTLKKDFLNDQALLHHAGALEMAALSSYLSSTPEQNLKNYPERYMEHAIDYYSNKCGQPLLAVRCVLYSAEILVHLEKYAEAANQIIRITSSLSNIYGGVFLERAATLFGKSKMFRRQAFHSVLAGHRYEQSDLMQLAFQCYNKALPEYIDKLWTNAEDNVLCVVSRDPSLKADDRIECSQRLVRAYCMNQSEEQQAVFLKNYLRQTTDESRQLVVPIISDIRTFYGTDPTALSETDLTQQSISFAPDGMDLVPDPAWTDIERAAFLSAFGPSTIFRQVNSFATQYTNNTSINVTPINEKFTIQLILTNPLKIPLKLKHVKLDFKEVDSSGGQAFSFVSEIEELELPGISLVEANLASESVYTPETHETQIELFCIPTEHCRSFTINALNFDIVIGEPAEVFRAHVLIDVKGRRLFSKKEELTSKVYAVDNRLKARVSQKPHPLLNFQFTNHSLADQSLEIQTTSLNLFCSQTHLLNLQISNAGNCDINRLCAAFDCPEMLTIFDPQAGTQFQTTTLTSCPGVFISTLNQSNPITTGESLSLQLIIHAPSLPVENAMLKLVFFYTSADGIPRQWRHKIEITATPLIQAEICVLDAGDKLCALKVQNEINSRDSILVQIECLRLEAQLKTSTGYFVDLHPLSNRKVILDTDQSDIYCFYLRFTKSSSRAIVMSEDRNTLHWPYLLSTQSDHLRFALTWRAKITRDTTTSIHGQSIISNPFISFPADELNLLLETATPSIFVQTRLLRQLVPIEVGKNEKLLFTLNSGECIRQSTTECANKNPPETIKIPWSVDM